MDNIGTERYQFVRDEIQLIIVGEYQNERVTEWRKFYNKQNEGYFLEISNKVKIFFDRFKYKALELARFAEFRAQHPSTETWYERFGWRDFVITSALKFANLHIRDIAMYIENHLEFEEIYVSARTFRYNQRQEAKRSYL